MNESRRLFKQTLIAIIYLTVFSGSGIGLYFLLKPMPLPPLPPAPTIYPIEVVWSQVFTSGTDHYTIGAKIRNPNTNFGASSFNYKFYLYDTNNSLIDILTGKSFIWPGESKYVIDGGIKLSKAPIKSIMEIENPHWNEVKNFNGIDLTLGNVKYGKGDPGSSEFFVVNFTANNNTPFNLEKVYVSAVVLNKEKLPIAVGSTILENLKSKEGRFFSIPWFSQFFGTSASVDLSVSTNLWETPGLIKP